MLLRYFLEDISGISWVFLREFAIGLHELYLMIHAYLREITNCGYLAYYLCERDYNSQ